MYAPVGRVSTLLPIGELPRGDHKSYHQEQKNL